MLSSSHAMHTSSSALSSEVSSGSGREKGPAEALGREFLAFTLGREEYGIDILKVQEIRGYGAGARGAGAPGGGGGGGGRRGGGGPGGGGRGGGRRGGAGGDRGAGGI